MERELYKDLAVEYIDSQAVHFNELENKSGWSKLKNYSLVIFVLMLIVSTVFYYFGMFVIEDNNEMKSIISLKWKNLLLNLFILIFIYNCFVFKSKNNQIKKINQKYYGISVSEKIPDLGWVTQILLFILSPDYTYALKSKKQLINNIHAIEDNQNYNPRFFELKENNDEEISNYQWLKIQIERKFLVEWANWNNIFWSTVLFFIVIFLWFLEVLKFFDIENMEISEYVWFTFGCLVAIRIFSRGIEIVIAFYKDVVRVDGKMFYEKSVDGMSLDDKLKKSTYYNGFKFTLLRSQGRLSLAIHTLLEFCILFSSVYIILSVNITNFWGENYASTPLVAVLHSFSVSVFNVSFNASSNMLQNIFHVMQILISGILILLSVSQYLNGKNDFKEDTFEYKFYKAVHCEMKKSKKNENPINKRKSLFSINRNLTSSSKFHKESLGKKSIFYGEGIEINKINENHHVYTDKCKRGKITIKLEKRSFYLKEKLIVEQNCIFVIRIEGKKKIYIYLR